MEYPSFVPKSGRRRYRLWQGQCGVCFICLRSVHFEASTIEHVKPASEGGDNSPANLVMTCRGCNGHRGTEPLEKFKARVLKKRRRRVPLWRVDHKLKKQQPHGSAKKRRQRNREKNERAQAARRIELDEGVCIDVDLGL